MKEFYINVLDESIEVNMKVFKDIKYALEKQQNKSTCYMPLQKVTSTKDLIEYAMYFKSPKLEIWLYTKEKKNEHCINIGRKEK